MKIFSWNINGIRAVERKGALADFLSSQNPDIVCFQETKIDAGQLSKEKFEENYPEYRKFWSHAERKGYSGTAIWSKIKPKQTLHNFSPEILKKYDLSDKFGDASTEGRICAVEFDDFWLVTVYTPNAKNGLERLDLRQKWDAAFLEFIKSFEKPVFFCGDLNVAHEEIDLARPKQNRNTHGFTDQERAGFSNFIANGFVDIFRIQHPNEPNFYTWWSYFGKARERNVGWRIDYFLTNSNENPKIDAKIHPEIMGSDHCPVSIEWSENV